MLQCQLWVGLLTSFQSLPFINIYSSSSTKNNILELREQEKKKENQCEWDLITCSTGPPGEDAPAAPRQCAPWLPVLVWHIEQGCFPIDWTTKFSAFPLATE